MAERPCPPLEPLVLNTKSFKVQLKKPCVIALANSADSASPATLKVLGRERRVVFRLVRRAAISPPTIGAVINPYAEKKFQFAVKRRKMAKLVSSFFRKSASYSPFTASTTVSATSAKVGSIFSAFIACISLANLI